MTSSGTAASIRASNNWIVIPRPNPAATMSLVCYASAGHGPAMFRSWVPLLPPTIELAIAHLPGRESRWSEPSLDRMSDLVARLGDAIGANRDRPFAFFGHSLGGLIAFEVARYVRVRTRQEPAYLFASAHRAPQLPLRHRKIAGLSDQAFVAEVDARHGGIPAEVASNKELMDLMLPSLKADYRLFENYEYVADTPLGCSILAFGGTQDRYITETELAAWEQQTSGKFALRMIEGSHFFVNEARPAVVSAVVAHLNTVSV